MHRRKRVLSGILALWLLGNISYDHKKVPNYQIAVHQKYFARYSDGNVYIGNESFIKKLKNVSENDVLIVDGRKSSDSYVKILSSYKIMDLNICSEILEFISEYEKMHPSRWDRSINSMRVEWFMHNLLYYLNYERDRTKDVDFNNSEQEIYSKKLVKNLIK